MTDPNREILTDAVEKAIKFGWNVFGYMSQGKLPWYIVSAGQMPTPQVVENWVPDNALMVCAIGSNIYCFKEQVIYSHDFARALWGERLRDARTGNKLVEKKLPEGVVEAHFAIPAWQYHLQQMVVAEDPIKYLGGNI